LEELRGLRNFNPRAAATAAFFGDDPPVKPNGYAPGPNGAVQNGAAQNGATPDLTKPAKPSLTKNALPPIDDDAT
jgi:sec-independent protein translocase protein TatB